jgi:hypothetical protein
MIVRLLAAVLAPDQFGGQRVQALRPESAERAEPLINLLEWRGIDGVEAPGAVGADGGETAFPKDPEMLGHPGLGDAELLLDHLRNCSRGLLPTGQQLQDPAPDGIAENVERVHPATMSMLAYISQGALLKW